MTVSLTNSFAATQDVNLIPLTRIVTSSNKTVTTAGTRVQLVASSTPVSSCCIKAKSTNTGIIYVGNSTVDSNSYRLGASEEICLDLNDAQDVYLDSSVNGEGVTFICGK